MINKRKAFIKKGLEQLNYIFGTTESPICCHNKELIMATYMHIIAYAYDDREHIDKTDDEMLEIANKTVRNDAPSNSIGKVLRCKPEDAHKLNLLKEDTSEEGRKKWAREFSRFILEKTRNAICHGCFVINDDDTITIDNTTHTNPFKITYNFECLCDVCEELADKKQLEYYRGLLNNLKKREKINMTDPKNKLVFFDLLVNLLISYNENEVYHSNEIIDEINKLCGTHFSLEDIKHIRNSVTHHYRCFSGDDDEKILILDYRDKNRDRMSSNFPLEFSKILDLSCSFKIESLDSSAQNREDIRE